MASRPKRPEPRPQPRLYLITPQVTDVQNLAVDLASALAGADVAAVLLRLDDSDERSRINRVKALAPVVQDKGAALLLDGHPDLVARSGADGAHLTSMGDFHRAFDTLKPDRIAGVGGLASRHDVMLAAEAGADYILFGGPQIAFEATRERVNWAAALFELPCVAYADSAEEVAALVGCGADFIALDFIWHDPRGVVVALADVTSQLRLPEPV